MDVPLGTLVVVGLRNVLPRDRNCLACSCGRPGRCVAVCVARASGIINTCPSSYSYPRTWSNLPSLFFHQPFVLPENFPSLRCCGITCTRAGSAPDRPRCRVRRPAEPRARRPSLRTRPGRSPPVPQGHQLPVPPVARRGWPWLRRPGTTLPRSRTWKTRLAVAAAAAGMGHLLLCLLRKS